MASATVLTLTKIDATSDVVTTPASNGCICCRNTGSAYRLLIDGNRYLAATPRKPSAMAIGRHNTAATRVELRAASGDLVAEIAWMMNWVEKIAPAVPMIQAPILPPLRLPLQV